MPAYYEDHLALSYYRADLEQIPRLSREEETALVERLRLAREQAPPPEVITAAKHRLVEGNQRLVLFLALKHVRSFARLDLEDLIQEGSLALLEATERCSFLHGSFSGYASVAIRGAFSKARAHDWPVSITRDILQALYERDAIRNDAVLHAYSLDTPLPGRKDLTLAETLAASPLCLSSNDAPQKTEVVKGLLSGLTERQRQVVSLRYGLDEADRRECSLAEIAARLDMTESGVCDTLKKAAARCLRLAAKGNQPQPQHAAPHCYQPPRNERMAHKRLEQVAKLREAEQSLRERGERITGKQLAALAHVDSRVAHKYVRTHPDPDYEAVVQARQWQRLEDACAQLEVQGQPVTLNRLVRFTLVSLKEASAFLDARVGDARERLVLAYAQLQTQGLKTIGRKRLAQAAQVSQHRAELFLREQAGRASS